MATICTHCGREVPPGNTVCPACGENVQATAPAFTPVVQPGTPPPPAYTQPGYAQPGYAQSATPYATPPPPAKSGSAVKIILIVVGVFVFLGILAAAVVGIGIWRVSKAVHKNANGDVSISTPGGTITSGNSVSESDLGIAIYPGATQAASSSMNMHTPSGSLVSAAFVTSDSPSQVADFYKSKIGDSVSSMQAGGSTILTSGADSKDKVVVTITTVDGGKTRVNILHSTKK